MSMAADPIAAMPPALLEPRDRIEGVLRAFLREMRTEMALVATDAVLPIDEVIRLVEAGGKRLRPAFCYWGFRAAGGRQDGPIARASAAMELLHTMALIHDDLMDDTSERRGVLSSARHLANEARRWARSATAPDLARAERLYREAVAVDPTQSLVWQGLARVLLAAGRQGEAESVLADGALRALPPGPLDRELINLILRDGRSEAALPRLVLYLRDRPDDREMQHALIVALGQTGRPEQAIEAARRFVASGPDDPQGYVDLGVLLARSGRRDEAREAFIRGLQRRPSDPNLRRNLELLGPSLVVPPPP